MPKAKAIEEPKEEEFDEALNLEYRDARKRALDSALYLVRKELQWVFRYFQARMNALLVNYGVRVDESYDMQIKDDMVLLTIKAKLTEECIKDMTKVILMARKNLRQDVRRRGFKLKSGKLEILKTVKGG